MDASLFMTNTAFLFIFANVSEYEIIQSKEMELSVNSFNFKMFIGLQVNVPDSSSFVFCRILVPNSIASSSNDGIDLVFKLLEIIRFFDKRKVVSLLSQSLR